MLYLHPEALTPDPTYGRKPDRTHRNRVEKTLYPHSLLSGMPQNPALSRWGGKLNLFRRPAALKLVPDHNGSIDLLLDFGTEIDAELLLELNTGAPVNLMICFGESESEARGLVPSHNPNPTLYWHLEKGRRLIKSETRGFRFVRLVFSDVRRSLTIHGISVHAEFTFRDRPGDFHCSDSRFQRAWQSSVYTARLCTKEATIWDGIKRDRVGWYGDARIIKLAVDNVFFDPRPAEAMLMALPTDTWANNIPNYSFDAMAMLRQHILFYGADRACIRTCYEKMLVLLDWIWHTQTNREGLIVRTDRPYFGMIGFLDWSPFPVGGRFEELCWLQCKYLEALRNVSMIAGVLEDQKTVRRLSAKISKLKRLLVKRFWNGRKGFVHTLNHVGNPSVPHDAKTGWFVEPFNVPMFGVHYRKTYEKGIRLGPSKASRQSNALAVLAGLVSEETKSVVLRKVFDNPGIPDVKTAYFSYYEQSARALCGDARGAIMYMRDYIGNMLESEDSATIWELYDPEVIDQRKFIGSNGRRWGYLWTWPISLCHGWGAGIVPIAAEHFLGVVPVEPGFRTVSLNPCLDIPWSFDATIPTPRGTIRVEREKAGSVVHYTIPGGIRLSDETEERRGRDIRIN